MISCNHDCFNCPYPDVPDECLSAPLTYDEYKESSRIDSKSRYEQKTNAQKKVYARNKSYREANKEKLADKQSCIRDVEYPPILDVCCGSKMFYFDKNNSDVLFCDNRKLHTTLCDGRALDVSPDIICDFKQLPFPDDTFNLVIFDPPHLVRAGEQSYMGLKYGVLPDTWRQELKDGMDECFRVVKCGGTIVFKWNEDQIKLSDVLKAIGRTPICGTRGGRLGKTMWLIFYKP